MATHSSVLAWRIPGMGELDGLPSMGSHRVKHDWSDLAVATAGISPEKAMAPHSSTLARRIPWTEKPGRLQSMGSLRVGHDWHNLAAAAAAEKPYFLPSRAFHSLIFSPLCFCDILCLSLSEHLSYKFENSCSHAWLSHWTVRSLRIGTVSYLLLWPACLAQTRHYHFWKHEWMMWDQTWEK